MKFLLAQKLGMSQVWNDAGAVVPVTVLSVLPNTVTQVRTKEKDGYAAVQLGMSATRRLAKPQRGHLKHLGNFRWLREFRIGASQDVKRGDAINISTLSEGDVVAVTATSKGKGFAGVMKRHHFKGGPASHGHPHNQRAPGSIGCRFPQHVHKGKRMAGRMGAETVTVRNLRVVKVDTEHNLLAVKGAIPGARGTLVKIISRN